MAIILSRAAITATHRQHEVVQPTNSEQVRYGHRVIDEVTCGRLYMEKLSQTTCISAPHLASDINTVHKA